MGATEACRRHQPLWKIGVTPAGSNLEPVDQHTTQRVDRRNRQDRSSYPPILAPSRCLSPWSRGPSDVMMSMTISLGWTDWYRHGSTAKAHPHQDHSFPARHARPNNEETTDCKPETSGAKRRAAGHTEEAENRREHSPHAATHSAVWRSGNVDMTVAAMVACLPASCLLYACLRACPALVRY